MARKRRPTSLTKQRARATEKTRRWRQRYSTGQRVVSITIVPEQAERLLQRFGYSTEDLAAGLTALIADHEK